MVWVEVCLFSSSGSSDGPHSLRPMAMKGAKDPKLRTTECDTFAVGGRLRVGRAQSAVARFEVGHQRLSLLTLPRATSALGCDVRLVIAGEEAV